MARYQAGSRHRTRVPRRIWFLLVVLAALAFGGMVLARHVYDTNLGPVSNSQTTQIFTVPKGSSVREIADKLQDAHLIRSSWVFQLYVQRQELSDQLQAGTYALSPSAGIARIVKTLTSGKVATRLVTILPGRRIDQVRADLINDGFLPDEVDAALDPGRYSDVPVLAYKPADIHTLEGLLWPDSYQREPDTDPAVIIRESLMAMGAHLTTDMQAGFAAQGLTTYQGLILTSIVIQEVGKPVDQAQAAQVFLSRLKTDHMLGSDVTARYGAIVAGQPPTNLKYDSPYNTLLHTGLPPSPISTINSSSMTAVLHPAATNWMYFVTGDDGTTYFSSTLEDHEALTQKYCHRLCGR